MWSSTPSPSTCLLTSPSCGTTSRNRRKDSSGDEPKRNLCLLKLFCSLSTLMASALLGACISRKDLKCFELWQNAKMWRINYDWNVSTKLGRSEARVNKCFYSMWCFLRKKIVVSFFFESEAQLLRARKKIIFHFLHLFAFLCFNLNSWIKKLLLSNVRRDPIFLNSFQFWRSGVPLTLLLVHLSIVWHLCRVVLWK